MDQLFYLFGCLLKFLSYGGILAGIATATMFLGGSLFGAKNLNPQKSKQSFGLFFLGIWMIIALVLVLGKRTTGIVIGQATFVGYSLYLLVWDSRKDKANGWPKNVSLVFEALLLTQPINAFWIWITKLMGG